MAYSAQQILISEDIFKNLQLVAVKNNMEVDNFVNDILKDFLKENFSFHAGLSEKRKHKRKKMITPALVYEKHPKENTGRYLTTSVLDISPGGVRLALLMDREPRIELAENKTEFEIFLYLTDTEVISRFKCRLKHFRITGQMMNVGGTFLECDEHSRLNLNNYLNC